MSEWDSAAGDWDDDPAARAYAAAAYTSLQSVLGHHGRALDTARVLDFGSGSGLLTEQMVTTADTVIAVDTSTKMIEVIDAKVADRGWTNVVTSTELAAATGRFDLVVCSSVCSFLDDYPATAAHLVSLLVPGGIFVQWDWERDPSELDGHGFTPDEITQALVASGLTDVDTAMAFEVEIEGQQMTPLVGHGRKP